MYFYLSAAHKSSGKTTLAIGLAAALRAKGLAVQPFKKGPDYIDPLWLTAAAGRPCVNLDFYTMTQEEIGNDFAAALQGADLGLIEGNKGLFDGLALDGGDSNAAMAALLKAPVILVLDTAGLTRGVAPLLQGYLNFEPKADIVGVILNKVGGARHEGKLRAVIEHYTGLPVLGAVARDPGLRIEERHLGLMPSNEAEQAEAKIRQLRDAVAGQVDTEAVLALARTAQRPAAAPAAACGDAGQGLRVGYARDRAFGFYYPDDLQAIADAGARLIAVDMLREAALPELDGLFLGGGFPETAMHELAANASMRRSVRDYIEQGGVAYAECGGLMYLCKSIHWHEQQAEMVGVIDARAVMRERPVGRGYVRLRRTGDHPWPGACAEEAAAHEFHYSAVEGLPADTRFAFEVVRGHGVDGRRDGIVHKNLLANYTHLRNVGGYRWVERFLGRIRAVKSGAAAPI